jgi:transaldolase
MTRLQDLYTQHGQSPWLDNITRRYLRDGTLARLVTQGIRGVTANPTTFAKAIAGSTDYDDQFIRLTAAGRSVEDAYWELVVSDVRGALATLRPVYDASGRTDGFVSVEVAPELARDTPATIVAARDLHKRIDEPNLLVKIPATAEGIPAIEAATAEGHSINVTLIFSLSRYAQVIEAFIAGLEAFSAAGGELLAVHSVASFFVSRVDREVDSRLESVGSAEALGLRGLAAIAQAKLAYRLFRNRFAGRRWERLAALGAHHQRPLWASTATKNPAYPDTIYVDSLIGDATVTTLPESTIAAYEDHGSAARTIDTGMEDAADVIQRLATAGIDMDDVGRTLENQGVAAFHTSFQRVLATLEAKTGHGSG